MGSWAHKSPKWGSGAGKIWTPSLLYSMHPYQSNYAKKKKVLARKSHWITSRPTLILQYSMIVLLLYFLMFVLFYHKMSRRYRRDPPRGFGEQGNKSIYFRGTREQTSKNEEKRGTKATLGNREHRISRFWFWATGEESPRQSPRIEGPQRRQSDGADEDEIWCRGMEEVRLKKKWRRWKRTAKRQKKEKRYYLHLLNCIKSWRK